MNTCKYVIHKEAGWWHFRLLAANGKTLFTSHPYAKRINAQEGIKVIANIIRTNPVVTFA